MANAYASQAYALAVYSGEEALNSTRASQLFALGVYDGLPEAYFTRASQLFALGVYEGNPSPYVQSASASQLFALGVYGAGAPEDLRLLAWSFIMDGHKLYVLKLGELGTYVWDMTTGLWSKWDTVSYTYWNNFLGFVWDGRILAADGVSSTIWEIDPELWNDEGFKDIVHVVTAIIPMTGRDYHSLDEVYLEFSSGYYESLAPYLLFEYSDDRGTTWETPEDGLIYLQEGEFKEEVSWLGLGSFTAPGRVIRITDVGGPITIEMATMRMDGEE